MFMPTIKVWRNRRLQQAKRIYEVMVQKLVFCTMFFTAFFGVGLFLMPEMYADMTDTKDHNAHCKRNTFSVDRQQHERRYGERCSGERYAEDA